MLDTILYILLTLVDLLYTRFMLNKYGLEIEQNPLIPYLMRKLGWDEGLMVGILIPSIFVLGLGVWFPPLLETLLFARFILFFMQASHIRTELCLSPRKTAHN